MGGGDYPWDWVNDAADDVGEWLGDTWDYIDGDAMADAEAAAAAQQAEYEAAMAAEMAANQAYMEEQARRNRISSITDTRAQRKAQLLKRRKKLAGKKAAEKRGAEGARITGVAAARGGTGALKSGKSTRGSSTKMDYDKWGKKGGVGLSLKLRGGADSGRRPS